MFKPASLCGRHFMYSLILSLLVLELTAAYHGTDLFRHLRGFQYGRRNMAARRGSGNEDPATSLPCCYGSGIARGTVRSIHPVGQMNITKVMQWYEDRRNKMEVTTEPWEARPGSGNVITLTTINKYDAKLGSLAEYNILMDDNRCYKFGNNEKTFEDISRTCIPTRATYIGAVQADDDSQGSLHSWMWTAADGSEQVVRMVTGDCAPVMEIDIQPADKYVSKRVNRYVYFDYLTTTVSDKSIWNIPSICPS